MNQEEIVTKLEKMQNEIDVLKKRKRHFRFLLIAGIAIIPVVLFATSITKPYTFTTGTKASSTEMNANFDALFTKVNELDGRLSTVESTALPQADFAVIHSTFANGVNEGGCTSGSWYDRVINTIQGSNGSSITLNSNQITLTAGTYLILSTVPGYGLSRHRAKLRNISDSTDAILGTSEYTASGNNVATRSIINGIITITATKVFSLQQQCEITYAGALNAPAAGFGATEVYSTILIRKMK